LVKSDLAIFAVFYQKCLVFATFSSFMIAKILCERGTLMKYITITKLDVSDYVNQYDVLVCQVRPSRIKAKQWAAMEISSVLAKLDPIFITNTPIGDIQGLIAFFVPKGKDITLRDLLNHVGYCNKFYKLNFNVKQRQIPTDNLKSINPYTWKGLPFIPIDFFTIDEETFEAHSVMNRVFAVYQQDFTVKYIKGYRGDGSETGRRALPLEDARLMANLALPLKIKRLLDPFAGGGGIIHAAKCVNEDLHLISADVDRTVEPGLKLYATQHHTCDARELKLDEPIDAIVTEVPFSMAYTDIIIEAICYLAKYLTSDGRLILMCHRDQFLLISTALTGLFPVYYRELDRKGTPITISYWTKDKAFYEATKGYATALREFI